MRARTPESGANISRSSPQQQRRTLSISEEVSRKINGLSKAEEGESSVWERERLLQVEMSLLKELRQSCDIEKGTAGRMAPGGVKDDALSWKG